MLACRDRRSSTRTRCLGYWYSFLYWDSELRCMPNGYLASQVRKPYTITKQRERWTNEEHELFLEALDKYGRAWQSIQGNVTRLAVKLQIALSSTSRDVMPAFVFFLQSTSELKPPCKSAVMLKSSSPNSTKRNDGNEQVSPSSCLPKLLDNPGLTPADSNLSSSPTIFDFCCSSCQ